MFNRYISRSLVSVVLALVIELSLDSSILRPVLCPPRLRPPCALNLTLHPPLHRAVPDGDDALYSSVVKTVVDSGELFPGLLTTQAELALVCSMCRRVYVTLRIPSVRSST